MRDFWLGRANLDIGDEAIFFLRQNPVGGFLEQIEYGLRVEKSALKFENHRKEILRLLGIFDDPKKALTAEKASDRQFAACALVARYRNMPPILGEPSFDKSQIDSNESRLILKALSEMKWDDLPFDANGAFSLRSAFYRLQLTDKDGWIPPPDGKEDANEVLGKAATKWIKENVDKYRIQRLVAKAPATK